jgi:hypothetical protein
VLCRQERAALRRVAPGPAQTSPGRSGPEQEWRSTRPCAWGDGRMPDSPHLRATCHSAGDGLASAGISSCRLPESWPTSRVQTECQHECGALWGEKWESPTRHVRGCSCARLARWVLGRRGLFFSHGKALPASGRNISRSRCACEATDTGEGGRCKESRTHGTRN